MWNFHGCIVTDCGNGRFIGIVGNIFDSIAVTSKKVHIIRNVPEICYLILVYTGNDSRDFPCEGSTTGISQEISGFVDFTGGIAVGEFNPTVSGLVVYGNVVCVVQRSCIADGIRGGGVVDVVHPVVIAQFQ